MSSEGLISLEEESEFGRELEPTEVSPKGKRKTHEGSSFTASRGTGKGAKPRSSAVDLA